LSVARSKRTRWRCHQERRLGAIAEEMASSIAISAGSTLDRTRSLARRIMLAEVISTRSGSTMRGMRRTARVNSSGAPMSTLGKTFSQLRTELRRDRDARRDGRDRLPLDDEVTIEPVARDRREASEEEEHERRAVMRPGDARDVLEERPAFVARLRRALGLRLSEIDAAREFQAHALTARARFTESSRPLLRRAVRHAPTKSRILAAALRPTVRLAPRAVPRI
jgi:hypothetical protein